MVYFSVFEKNIYIYKNETNKPYETDTGCEVDPTMMFRGTKQLKKTTVLDRGPALCSASYEEWTTVSLCNNKSKNCILLYTSSCSNAFILLGRW